MSEFKIPAFPTEVSEPIDMPDIGELLMYPAFQGILAEDFMRHATEFQKYLFSKVPLRNDMKVITIRSGVWLLEPGIRSHVGGTPGLGWHVDGITPYDFREPLERVFILSTPCTALTQFNLNEINITDSPSDEDNESFFTRMNNDPLRYGIIGKTIEPNRIYTFQNHLHRAVDAQRIEFRYFLRVRETNGSHIYHKEPIVRLNTVEVGKGTYLANIEYGNTRVTVYKPRTLR